MPKLVCPCGFVHNLSLVPDDGWITIRDRDDEAVQNAKIRMYEIAGHKVPASDDPNVDEWDKLGRYIAEKTGLLYKCPECKRLMWREAYGDSYTVYTKEADVKSD